jgi:LacI family transcriptional regulator
MTSSGKRRTTIRDVARHAQVAPITVSRVVNNVGPISPETRQRVEAAIQELNYIPNTLAQSLRYQKTNLVALIVTDITNPFWTTVARGVEDACNIHSVNVIVCNTDEKKQKLDNYLNLMLQRQIDGLIVVPTEDYDGSMLENLFANAVPSILLDRTLPGWQNHTIVRSDSVMGSYLLTKHLLELGHRRIMMISGSNLVSTGLDRAEGYRRALEEFGVPIDPELIRFGSFTRQSGYDIVLEMLQTLHPRPTAIVTANNFIAVGVIKALDEQGIRIPDDMSLATFDDLPEQINPRPFLTTVVQNPYQMGQEAAERLISLLQGSEAALVQDIMMPVELIIRTSTAPPALT